MRRFAALVSIALVFLGLIAISPDPGAIAQEATPAAEDMAPEEGITFELVGFAVGVDLPSLADLSVSRVGLEPGTGFPIADTDPTTGVLVVESGTFTVQVEGEFTVNRGAGMGEALATADVTGDLSGAIETIAAGEVVTLDAGDTAYIPGSINGEIRNDGEERAVGLAFLIHPSGEMAAATPAP
jgi:hypothetical protein